ncbi:MAG: hypothetical protein HW405_1006, partial [Candidatus Berkelbacteria bacterium]|nr:hypothetical protein [Candidatus Berkelbacteria bacterium]
RSQDIKINETEIFWQDNLISRFGSKILAASFYPDSKHIIFQEATEIRIIDLDGSNNVLLVSLKSNEPTAFTFQNNGKTLIYLDGGQIFAKTIR